MKFFCITLLVFTAVKSNGITLDDFLSSTLVDKKTTEIEEAWNLNSGTLNNTPAYVDIGELTYAGIQFKVSLFCRTDECQAYGLWANQIRIKDKSGRLIHGDNAEITDVFQVLLRKVTAEYGEAPRVKIESKCCGCESSVLSSTYAWTNEKYALVLRFHDNITSQSITLRQYRRDERKGEFTGENELKNLQEIYNNRSGSLPARWPVQTKHIEKKRP